MEWKTTGSFSEVFSLFIVLNLTSNEAEMNGRWSQECV